MHRQLLGLPEQFVHPAAPDGELGLGYDSMRRMAEDKRNALVQKLPFEALGLSLLLLQGIGVHQAEAIEFLGGAAKELVLLTTTGEGATGRHAGIVAPKDVRPGIRAMHGLWEEGRTHSQATHRHTRTFQEPHPRSGSQARQHDSLQARCPGR